MHAVDEREIWRILERLRSRRLEETIARHGDHSGLLRQIGGELGGRVDPYRPAICQAEAVTAADTDLEVEGGVQRSVDSRQALQIGHLTESALLLGAAGGPI